MLVTQVAGRALARRFDEVQRFLALAGQKSPNDVEHVHQLRVATRRAVAAMDIFAPVLPASRAGRMRKELRRLRRAVGQARDLDVLAERLERLSGSENKNGTQKVLRRIAKLRKEAQRPARKAYRRALRQHLKRRMRRLIKRIRPPADFPQTFGSFARQRLPVDVAKFFQAATSDLSQIEALHEMRIVGKRLRYALEIYAGAFPDALRHDLYPVFAIVQEKLGEINDHATALRLFDTWRQAIRGKKAGQRMQLLVADEQRRLDAACEAFRQWWTPPRAESLKTGFQQLLADTAVEDERDELQGGRNVPVGVTSSQSALASSLST